MARLYFCEDGSAWGLNLAGRHRDDACEDGLSENGTLTEKISASQLFDVSNEQLSENPNEIRDAIKGQWHFSCTTRGNSGVTDSWHIDLKSSGRSRTGFPACLSMAHLICWDPRSGQCVAVLAQWGNNGQQY
ncbi:hypothetical protein LLEC1_03291 [Akanthomyces lecanii]|uniref:Uncharacterized protein n=1 Tax=Cordyceps confragosa TaxID=2714763 RepID=A0A179IBQ4_CORDF|nr:hypothetical protein LLEC1_03291 [Akanthomyces lecanii]